MRKTSAVLWAGILLASLCGSVLCAKDKDAATAKSLFANPPNTFTTAPLWVWNDMLTEEQVVSSLRDLAAQGIKQAFVHPRPGLMTPYMSDDWFRLWKAALAEAKRLDMLLWIYDENSYPSGFAGGLVPDAMPESRQQGLTFSNVKKVPASTNDLAGVFRITGNSYEDVTAQVRAGAALPRADYLVAQHTYYTPSPWTAGKGYVDLIRPGVTQKFLELTLEPYRKHFGNEFGKRIPGSFTDEPELWPRGNGIHWTDDLPAAFQKRWGYDLVQHLPCLTREVGDWKKVRHDTFALLNELFIERWAKPYYDYCSKHHLEFTGHYWDHAWPNCRGVPDNMAMAAWQQRPGIDCLMNQYKEECGAQFGNVRLVKELSSVANQMGRSRTLCEAYGAGGWDLRFEDMKRIADWLLVLGVNTLDQHLTYVTLRGARKRDHPQSFSYHEPWWNDYRVMADYLTRLTYATTLGKQVNHILLIEPTTTAWMYQSSPQALKELGQKFFDTLMELERAQIEYDLGDEDIMARNGRVSKNRAGAPMLEIGKASYDTVIIPPMTESLDPATVGFLEKFAQSGGRVFCCGKAPERVEGRLSDRVQKLAQSSNWKQVEQLPVSTLRETRDGFVIDRESEESGILFHRRQRWNGGEIVLLVNTSIEKPANGVVKIAGASVEQWDPATGKILPYPFTKDGARVAVKFSLPPCGSLLLNATADQRTSPAPVVETATTIAPTGSVEVKKVEPNVLTIDHVDVTVDGETQKNLYFYKAAELVFVKHGLKQNPWERATQFKDELLRTKFTPESGFEITYRFNIADRVPENLSFVVERSDLYTITCNGNPVSAAKDSWWLDRAFGRLKIASAAKTGENSITLKAAKMTVYHEVEPAYLLGDFSLKATERGFDVCAGGKLSVGPSGWNEQGHPFYAAGVSYTERFEVSKVEGKFSVAVPDWYGSVARVVVNGKAAGCIYNRPWECDVTSLIRPGQNQVEVIVVGTLKNTLGPHHGNPVLGTAWPAQFQKPPQSNPPAGKDYHTVSYGLRQPFVLKQSRAQ